MAKAEIIAGGCGFNTTVVTTKDGDQVGITIESECKAIQRMAEELKQVNPFKEISTRRGMPLTLEMGHKYCTHAACPVPVGIIKAIEVEAGLALPADASIKLSK
jgi:hypothetical protein